MENQGSVRREIVGRAIRADQKAAPAPSYSSGCSQSWPGGRKTSEHKNQRLCRERHSQQSILDSFPFQIAVN